MERNIYSLAKISTRTLDIIITVGVISLALLILALSVCGGYKVSFDTNGGSQIEDVKLRYGDTIAEPSQPVKEDCVFVGWYEDEEFQNEFDFENTTVTGDVTIFAAWKQIP